MRRYRIGALLFATAACGSATSISEYERLQAEAERDAVRQAAAADADAPADDQPIDND